jgi:UDP:flavonoid glycosyltransferase YjiC (YdhE family)
MAGMRMLFTFAGGRGHLEPLVPIARVAQRAGHAVAVAGQAGLIDAIRGYGFEAFSAGPPVGRTAKTPLLPLDPAREELGLRRSYAGWIARGRANDLLTLCADWRPDLLVCDEFDFGAMIAAERLAIPHATVLVSAAGTFIRKDVVVEPLNALRSEHGLPPDDELRMPSRHLVLSPFPPAFRDPGTPLPANAFSLRWTAADETPVGCPAFAEDAPLVYATLGTVFNLESGDLFNRVLAGLRETRMNVVLTVGDQIDPREFGRQPDRIRLERFVPQSAILAHCSGVLSHGGSGSVMGALAYGLPQVVIPMGADQPHNAKRCAALGLGVVLDPVAATPEMINNAISSVLAEPAYRAAAERIRDEIAALPPPASVVSLLERLPVSEARWTWWKSSPPSR